MQCATTQEQISRLLDHELPTAEAQAIFSHLGACMECTAFYTQTARIAQRFRMVAEVPYPSALDARILHAAAHRRLHPKSAVSIGSRMRAVAGRRLTISIPAAIAVFIAGIGLSLVLMKNVAPGLLPVEKETKIVVAYPPVEIIADDALQN